MALHDVAAHGSAALRLVRPVAGATAVGGVASGRLRRGIRQKFLVVVPACRRPVAAAAPAPVPSQLLGLGTPRGRSTHGPTHRGAVAGRSLGDIVRFRHTTHAVGHPPPGPPHRRSDSADGGGRGPGPGFHPGGLVPRVGDQPFPVTAVDVAGPDRDPGLAHLRGAV